MNKHKKLQQTLDRKMNELSETSHFFFINFLSGRCMMGSTGFEVHNSVFLQTEEKSFFVIEKKGF